MYDLKLIGERIKTTRKEKDMTLDDIAKAVGVARSTIQRYEVGVIVAPKVPVLMAIARVLKVNEKWLMGLSDDKQIRVESNSDDDRVAIPLLGEVAAGMGSYASDNIVGYIFEDKASIGNEDEYAYLKVVGDSMYPEFKAGDLVLVKCQPTVESGSYAIVMVDDELGVVKRVVYTNDFIELQSVNPMYPPRRFEGEDVARIRIFGVVKGMKRIF